MENKGFWRKLFRKKKKTETNNKGFNHIWMNSEKCENGHWYDNSIYDSCPYCGNDQEKGIEEKMINSAGSRTEVLGLENNNCKCFPGMSMTTVCLNDNECNIYPEKWDTLDDYTQASKEREEDEFPQRLDLSYKKCPNCGNPLYIFQHFITFGDDDGYLCLKCHFKGYYGGTRCEGQSLWQVVNEGINLKGEASD